MQYLLDTNICVDAIRGRNVHVIERLKALPQGGLGISAITLGELEHGVARSQRPEQNRTALYRFCTLIDVLPFDAAAAQHYGPIRSDLERIGEVIGPMDLLIAAHARALGATLITNNDREFRRVQGLVVEDWRS